MSSTSFDMLAARLSDIHQHGIDLASREIYVHGYYKGDVEEEPGVDYRMATTFIKNLRLLDQTEESNILVHQHTCGGYWNDGMAMYDAITHCRSTVSVLLYSHSRSMSSIIPQAADLRILLPNTDVMLHYGTYATEGTYTAVESEFNFSKHSCRTMLDIYAERCQHGRFFKKQKAMTLDKVREFLHKHMVEFTDWWLTAEQAVDYGLADGILGDDNYPTIEHCR